MLFISVVLCWILNHSKTQTRIVEKVLFSFSQKLEGQLLVKNVRYRFPYGIELNNLLLLDKNKDTALYLQRARIQLSHWNPKKIAKLHALYIHGLDCRLIAPQGDSMYRLMSIFRPLMTDTQKSNADFPIKIKNLNIEKSKFLIRHWNEENIMSGRLNPKNLVLNNIEIGMKNFFIYGDSMSAKVQNLSAESTDGFLVESMESARCIISPKVLSFDQLLLKTNQSKIKGNVSLNQNMFQDLEDFSSKVKMQIELEASEIHSHDLNYFTGELSFKELPILIRRAEANGTLNNLKIKQCDIALGKNNYLRGQAMLRGLPNIEHTFIQADIEKSSFDLSDLKRTFSLSNIPNVDKDWGPIHFAGNCKGYYNKMFAVGNWNTTFGAFFSDLKFDFTKAKSSYVAHIKSQNFDVGRLYKKSKFGNAHFLVKIEGEGRTLNDLRAKLNGDIKAFSYNNYTYRNIHLGGRLENKQFEGNFEIEDSNLQLYFEGLADLQKKEVQLDCNAKIYHANLSKLGFAYPFEKFAAEIDFELFGQEIDELYGLIHLRQIDLTKADSTVHFKNIAFLSEYDALGRNIRLESDFIDLNLEGFYNPTNLKRSISKVINAFVSDSSFMPNARKDPFEMQLTYHLKKPEIWSYLFDLPFVLGSGKGYIKYTPSRETMDAYLTCSKIQFQNLSINNPVFSMDEEDETHIFSLTHKKIHYLKTLVSDAGQFRWTQKPNHDFGYSIAQKNNAQDIDLFAKGKLILSSIDSLKIVQELFQIKTHKQKWEMPRSASISWINEEMILSPFALVSGNQKISVQGKSTKKTNELQFFLSNLDLQSFGPFIESEVNIHGLANGNLQIIGQEKKLNTSGFLNINNMSVRDDSIGNLNLTIQKVDQKSEIKIHSELFQKGSIFLTSDAFLDYKTKWIELNCYANNFPAVLAQPFLEENLSNIEGEISLILKVKGPIRDPKYHGKVIFDKTKFVVDYTEVPYHISGAIALNSAEINLDNLYLTDKQNKRAQCLGKITHKNFKHMELQLMLDNMENFHLLNTNFKSKELFFGKVFFSGSARIEGPLNNIKMGIFGSPGPSSHIYLPLDHKSKNEIASFIQFGHPKNQLESQSKQSERTQQFELEMDLEVTEDAKMTILFDKNQGDSLYAKAKGNIKLRADEQNNLSVFGQLNLAEGIYRFSSYDLIKKDFVIDPSSRITFDGNPYKAKIDMLAIKQESTSPKALLDEEFNYSNNIPVDVQLKIMGYLDAFDIQFNLSFPSLNNQNYSNDLINGLEQLNAYPEEVKRQAVALLVLGTFIPPLYNQSPSENLRLNAAVNNSLGEFISNQASKLFGQINPKWDFNVNYNAENQVAQREVILSVKRKFLKDRLALSGSYDAANQKSNNYNINLEYDLTKDGNVKFVGFNKQSNDPNFGTDQNMNTTGVGILFRRSFDKFLKRKSVKLESH